MAFGSAYCDTLPVANSSLTRFDGRYFHLDFPLSAVATIIADTPDKLTVNCEFRSNRDLVGLLWTSHDDMGHPLLQYVEDRNYSGVKVGFVANPLYPYKFTVTVLSNSGNQVYRMFPYKIQGSSLVPSPGAIEITGPGPGLIYSVAEIFPDGAPTVPAGYEIYILDFDNMKTGFNFDGDVIDPRYIINFFFSITPQSYGLGPNARISNIGDIGYYGSKYVGVKDTGTLDYWRVNNVNPNLRLKKGDILQFTIVQPDKYVKTVNTGKKNGGKGGGDPIAVYTANLQTFLIQVNTWYMKGTSLYVKAENGPLKDVALIGGPANAVTLQLDTAIGNESLNFEMQSISVTGTRRIIGRRFYPQAEHDMQMTSGFDDTYNITPWRQVDNTYNLGYRGHFNLYMGMSHYFKAQSTGGNTTFINQVVKDAAEPLNYPTEVWCRNFFSQMQAYGYTFIWSTSYEILNTYCPDEWKQRDAYGSPALSGWSPPSSFLIPTFMPAMDYLARTIKHGMKLLDESGISHLMFQIGEPWWWDGSYTNGAPCIYDEYTKALYKTETGNDVPTPYYTNYKQPITDDQRPYLEWLGVKLGQSTNYIRDAVKAAYPASDGTLLFFTPQIMNPASEMLPIINFPESEWVYPNYDFVQIEDYDWIINGQLDLLPLTLEAATVKLGYPLDVVHYFVGFVNTARETWVWPNVNIATREAILNEIPNIYVWAYPQVIRDGITYDDTLYGTDPAVQPYVPPRRQIGVHIEDSVIRPIYFVQIGDDSFMNTSDRNIDWNGQTWYATGQFGKVEPMTEGVSATDAGWSMALSAVPLDMIDYTTDHLRAKGVKMYLGLADAANQLFVTPRLIGSGGILDNNVQIEANAGTIKVNVRSSLSDWHKASTARYTDEYQQILHPGDRGFKFIADLQQTKLKWGDQNA